VHAKDGEVQVTNDRYLARAFYAKRLRQGGHELERQYECVR
jgi:hypothetical protein